MTCRWARSIFPPGFGILFYPSLLQTVHFYERTAHITSLKFFALQKTYSSYFSANQTFTGGSGQKWFWTWGQTLLSKNCMIIKWVELLQTYLKAKTKMVQTTTRLANPTRYPDISDEDSFPPSTPSSWKPGYHFFSQNISFSRFAKKFLSMSLFWSS